jgi:amino acid transporter
MAADAPTEGVFIRRSSGLTRQVSGRDALAYCAMNPGLLYAFVYAMFIIPLFASYGGSHLPLAVLPVLMMFPIAGLYWYYSVTMPRSGGEYVYISRTLHPSLGLFANWMISITAISWLGLLTDWWLKWSIADSFIAHGIRSGNEGLVNVGTWFEGEWVRTILGTAALVAVFWIFMKGARTMMRLSYIAIAASWLAIVILGIAVLATSQSEFAGALSNLTGIDASAVVGYGREVDVLAVTFMATLLGGATYVVLNTLGATFSANIAGEIRGVSRSQALALFGALVIQMITWAAAYTLVYATGGANFWHGLTMTWFDGADVYPLAHHTDPAVASALGAGLGTAREPFPTLLLAFTGGGAFLIYLFAICFAVSTFISAAGLAFAPIRNVFAWSFDRLIPTKFAELDRRYRAPWLAIAAVVFVGWLFLVVDIWRPGWTAQIAFTITGWFVGWIVLGVAGMVFPVVRPHLYLAAPPAVQRGIPALAAVVFAAGVTALAALLAIFATESRTWGEITLIVGIGALATIAFWLIGQRLDGTVPFISLLGFVTLSVSAFVEWSILRPFFSIGGEDPALSWDAMRPIPFMMAAPVIIYIIAVLVARRREIPLAAQFGEVPPE